MKQEPAINRYFRSTDLEFVTGFHHRKVGPYCGFHRHSAFEIVYHIRGDGSTELRGGRLIQYNEGAVIIYPPEVDHNQKSNVPAEDICVHFYAPAPQPALFNHSFHIPEVVDHHLRDEFLELSSGYTPFTDEAQIHFNHRITALVSGLLLLLPDNRPKSAEEKVVDYADKAAEILRRRFGSLGRLESVAEEIGISYDYLRHLFRERYRTNLKQYLLDIQLSRAKDLLLRTVFPLKTVAELSGFSSDRYFCTCFKLRIGCTPDQFRRKNRAVVQKQVDGT